MGGGNPYNKPRRGGAQSFGKFHAGPRGGFAGGRGGGREGATREPAVMDTMLKLLFEKQRNAIFDPATGMLNLSNLRSCQDLGPASTSIDFNTSNFCDTLISVVQREIGNPRFVNLSSNGIKAPRYVLEAMVNLKMDESIGGISFENNRIDNEGALMSLKKFKSLQELVVRGNPVAKNPKFVAIIKKAVPTLLGIDGESISRQPLSLPWPVRPNYDGNQRFILEMIESNLLHQLSAKKFDPTLNLYAEKAHFSFTWTKANIIDTKIHGTHKDVRKDLERLKGSLCANVRDESTFRGHLANDRLQVIQKLRSTIYADKFTVLHEVSPVANVVFFDQPLMKVPTCVVTLHGRMMWEHSTQPLEKKILCFDRTLALTFTDTWSIANDTMTLRAQMEEPVYFADNASSLAQLERCYSIPKEVCAAIVKQCASDFEFANVLSEIGSPALLQECCVVANNDFSKAVLTARVANSRQLSPQAAFQQLAAANFVLP